MLDLLDALTSLHTLTLTLSYLFDKYIFLEQQSKTFDLISRQNKIKNISISAYGFDAIQLLLRLCPHIQHLTLFVDTGSLEKNTSILITKT